ncbi:hypothetical protein [Bradyrhizobium sp. AZCC 2230]|uniref:hypothetical protein n=1 Tax=Bradyrhizobium sp. AZCC 2230 TaxID=3117021 RepID=UPI002FF30632
MIFSPWLDDVVTSVPNGLAIDPGHETLFLLDAELGLERSIILDKVSPYPIRHVMRGNGTIHGVPGGVRLLHEIIEILQQYLVEVLDRIKLARSGGSLST